MKTKNNKRRSYLRLHHRGIMYLSIGVMLLCLCRLDNRVLTVFHQAYNEGFATIGAYMREGEMIRFPINFGVSSRVQTISGE